MKTGTVVKFVENKGFGFIRFPGAGKDVFVHVSDCINREMGLRVGDDVSFETEETEKGDKAIRVQVLTGERETPIRRHD